MNMKLPVVTRSLFIAYGLLLLACLIIGCKGAPEAEAPPEGFVPPSSPEIEQVYAEAKELSENNKWKQCVSLLKKVRSEAKNPEQQEKVLFLLGEGYFQLKNYDRAEEISGLYLTTFPATAQLNEVIARRYQVGLAFLKGTKSSLWGLKIVPATDKGLAIIKDMLKRYPYAESSAEYQFKLAEYFYKKKFYEKARAEYGTLILVYPTHPDLSKAQFRLADTYLREYQGPEYDKTMLSKAKKAFQSYLIKYPEDELVEQAQAKLDEIVSKEAEREYLVGCYYLSVDKKASADIYFKSIIEDYPGTDWAEKAKEMMARPEAE